MASHSKIGSELTEAETRNIRQLLVKIMRETSVSNHKVYNYARKGKLIVAKAEKRILKRNHHEQKAK